MIAMPTPAHIPKGGTSLGRTIAHVAADASSSGASMSNLNPGYVNPQTGVFGSAAVNFGNDTAHDVTSAVGTIASWFR